MTKTRRLGCLSRPFRRTQPEGFGLLLEDAKTILGQLQNAILRDQIEKISEASKIESQDKYRRFGLVQQAVLSPASQLRQDLRALGWDHEQTVTVISDWEPALPNLVRNAVGGKVGQLLDWWHISMRIQHVENAAKGLLQLRGFSGIPVLFKHPAETLRWWPLSAPPYSTVGQPALTREQPQNPQVLPTPDTRLSSVRQSGAPKKIIRMDISPHMRVSWHSGSAPSLAELP